MQAHHISLQESVSSEFLPFRSAVCRILVCPKFEERKSSFAKSCRPFLLHLILPISKCTRPNPRIVLGVSIKPVPGMAQAKMPQAKMPRSLTSSAKSVGVVETERSSAATTTWVRVRPILPHEEQAGAVTMANLALSSSGWDANTGTGAGVNALEGRTPIGGFTGIIGQEAGNDVVFERTIATTLRTVMRGGTASVFCYGYTGAGKTHTIFGTENDPGLYHRAASKLLEQVRIHNASIASSTSSEGRDILPLLLQATMVEVYNNDAYDLLGGRMHVNLRVNSNGLLTCRGATTKQALGEAEAAAKGADFTVTTAGLTTYNVNSEADLHAIYQLFKAHRAVGTSTEHFQSSRSHAVFRMEVVDAALLDAQATAEEAEAIKPALQKQFAATPKLAIKKKLDELEKALFKVRLDMAGMYARENSAVGGQLILTDLAGADSDSRDISADHSAAQRKESSAINMSLLALKECLRGLHAQGVTGITKKLPFRDSVITRLLEEVLVGKPGKLTDNVMLVNVAPLQHLEKKTINSLRYGQLYTATSTRV